MYIKPQALSRDSINKHCYQRLSMINYQQEKEGSLCWDSEEDLMKG